MPVYLDLPIDDLRMHQVMLMGRMVETGVVIVTEVVQAGDALDWLDDSLGADWQEASEGGGTALRRGDLLFWDGHVGLMVDEKHLIHASTHAIGDRTIDTVVTIYKEVLEAKRTFQKYKWPLIDVTRKSVEETAASIIKIHEIYLNNVK